MRIVPFDPDDENVVRGCADIRAATQEADDPQVPAESPPVVRGWLAYGWGENPGEGWTVVDEADGRVLGWYRLELPDLENRDRATVLPVVHPAFRRRGIGRALLRHAARRAADNGRSVLLGGVLQGTAGEAFAAQTGAKAGLVEARRVQDLTALPAGTVARLRATAAGKAAGYTVVSWPGRTPDEYVAKIAGALNAMNDAPSEEGWEDDLWDADRVRERHDAVLRVSPMRRYSVAALHDATGEVAGLTQVYIDPGVPWWGYQGLTAVTRAHRGHRLGLLVKTAMLEWLAEAEPALERIQTGNAASNSFMIEVNETLGYRLLEPAWQFFQLPISDLTIAEAGVTAR
jgi:RimJ/RimL family protein N-acetyltransferase